MSETPEVHIAGAGPAGLAAALTVARAGGRAIVHEHRAQVGERFGDDFQGIENWTTRSDALEEMASIGIEPTFECRPFREGAFYDPSGREYRYRSPEPLFYLVRRGRLPGTLDRSLEEQACSLGIEIRYREPRVSLPGRGIVASGPRSANVIAVGYVFETDLSDGVFGVLSDRLAPKGYGYLLIAGGRGTVASCLFDDLPREKLYRERTVEFFRQQVGMTMRNAVPFAGVGNAHLPRTAREGNLLLAGEAAGFQDALWGFGIRIAMMSGHLAARALLAGLPDQYDRLWRRQLGGVLKASIANRAVYRRLGDRGYVELMRRIARARDARAWLRGHYAFTLGKALLFLLRRR